ncbi:MAG: hypothetical protein RLY31_570 [Bacteroidota bacterium]
MSTMSDHMNPNPASASALDAILVGQGLAGTLLSYNLLRQGARILVIDRYRPGMSSAVAAGIINPVTGRRLAKSWMYETLMEHARGTYRDLERRLQVPLWHERVIHRALHHNFDMAEWDRRSSFPEYEGYLGETGRISPYPTILREAHGWGTLCKAAQVAVPTLLKAWRTHLSAAGGYWEHAFSYDRLEVTPAGVVYDGIRAKKIIFCEGAGATENPYFRYLPFRPTKGELLLVRLPGVRLQGMVRNQLLLVPHRPAVFQGTAGQDELYWAGSTSRWEYADPHPTPSVGESLVRQLQDMLAVRFEVVDHLAGIRPTVEDIRPYLGKHPNHPTVFIFNGLGTKGASLAPYFATMLTAHLVTGRPLDPAVSIGRIPCPE